MAVKSEQMHAIVLFEEKRLRDSDTQKISTKAMRVTKMTDISIDKERLVTYICARNFTREP